MYMCILTGWKRYVQCSSLLCILSRSLSVDRDIFPLCQDAVSEVGKPGYPGGFHFAKLQMAVSSNQPLAITFKEEFCLFDAIPL